MTEIELSPVPVPFKDFEFGFFQAELGVVGHILDTAENSVINLFFFLLLVFLDHSAMTDRHAQLVLIQFNFCHYFVFFWVVKCQLTSPLFFALCYAVVTFVYRDQILK